MNCIEQYHYCKNIIKNNVFLDFEVNYYRGLTKKKPHGIDNRIWNIASRVTGFAVDNNLTKYGKHYCIES